MNRTLMNRTLLTTTAFLMLAGSCLAQGTAQPGRTNAAPNSNQSTNAPAGGTTNTPAQPSGTQTPAAGTQAGQTAAQQNQAATNRLSFYSAQSGDMRASELIGAQVYNRDDNSIGEVEDLIVDKSKNIKAVVVSVGGFLGIGERNVAIEPNSLTMREQDGATRIIGNTSKDELSNAPAFDLANMDSGEPGTNSNATGGTSPNNKSTGTSR